MDDLKWELPRTGAAILLPTSNNVLFAERGTTGRFGPPFEMIERDIGYGASLKKIKVKPREIAIPLIVQNEESKAYVRSVMRILMGNYFNPVREGAGQDNRGPGVGALVFTTPDGTQRRLYCVYAGGMESVRDEEGTFHRLVLIFRAHDPFWYAVDPTVVPFTGGATTNFFPFFPMRVSASQIFGDVSVTNDGDVETWPVWTITGPGSGLVIRNLTTGKLISITRTFGAGEGATIDTRPGRKTVKTHAGVNLYPNMSADSSLFPLTTVFNTLRVEFNGTDANSKVELSFFKRYMSV